MSRSVGRRVLVGGSFLLLVPWAGGCGTPAPSVPGVSSVPPATTGPMRPLLAQPTAPDGGPECTQMGGNETVHLVGAAYDDAVVGSPPRPTRTPARVRRTATSPRGRRQASSSRGCSGSASR